MVADEDAPGDSRYTRTVSWKQFFGVLVLAILSGGPVSGTICALLCDSANSTASAGHHGSSNDCDEPARPSTDVQISGVSDHDCGTHDVAIRQATLTAAERANRGVMRVALTTTFVAVTVKSPATSGSHFQYTTPPGTAPPTTTPLILRA